MLSTVGPFVQDILLTALVDHHMAMAAAESNTQAGATLARMLFNFGSLPHATTLKRVSKPSACHRIRQCRDCYTFSRLI